MGKNKKKYNGGYTQGFDIDYDENYCSKKKQKSQKEKEKENVIFDFDEVAL